VTSGDPTRPLKNFEGERIYADIMTIAVESSTLGSYFYIFLAKNEASFTIFLEKKEEKIDF
jgi:hypothetical protein